MPENYAIEAEVIKRTWQGQFLPVDEFNLSFNNILVGMEYNHEQEAEENC